MEFDELVPEINPEKSPLSDRENRQLLYAAKDMSLKQIHDEVNRELTTLKTQRQSIMRKLGVDSIFKAVMVAIAMGIIVYKHRFKKKLKIEWTGNNLIAIVLAATLCFASVAPEQAIAEPVSSMTSDDSNNDTQNKDPLHRSTSRSLRTNRLKKDFNLDNRLDVNKTSLKDDCFV